MPAKKKTPTKKPAKKQKVAGGNGKTRKPKGTKKKGLA
jgi:hypothetical protein